MALITCPECGKQVSDKAEFCVGCGYPIEKMNAENEKKHNIVVSLDDLFESARGQKTLMIKKFVEITGCDFETASECINTYWNDKINEHSMYQATQKALENTDKSGKGGILTKIKCPRCWSVEYQVIDTKKKFSFGKALVGGSVGGVFGPVGAVVGAATGIKGKNGKTKFVCKHCGKVWEQKV